MGSTLRQRIRELVLHKTSNRNRLDWGHISLHLFGPFLISSCVSLSLLLLRSAVEIAIAQDIDQWHFEHSASGQHHNPFRWHAPRAWFHFLATTTRATTKTSFDSKFSVEEYCFHKRVLNRSVLIRCGKRHGALLQSLVSPSLLNPQPRLSVRLWLPFECS